MSYFDEIKKYYEGKNHDLILLDECKKKLQKNGTFYRVISRVQKICDSGNFGKPNTGYKYSASSNLGWLKWDDGTRVYFAKFQNNKIVILMTSGNKNNQASDIRKAEKMKNEITMEVNSYEKENED